MAMKASHLSLIVAGSVIIALVIAIAWLGLPKLVDAEIKNKVRLVEGSDTWDKWVNVPVPIHLKFYIYNVTNPQEIQKGEKPVVQEIGPFTYLERRKKNVINIDKSKDTVTYSQPITYYFDAENSNGTEDDLVTVLNMVFVAFIETGHKLTTEEFILTQLEELLTSKGEGLFRTQSVRELLFEGFSIQTYLEILNDPFVQSVGEGGVVKIPRQFENGKFGIFEGRNGSAEGVFEVKTGISNSTEFGQIVSWNNLTELTWWKDTCNRISGTDGSIYRPFLTKASRLNLFAPGLCRSMYFTFDSETEVEGVPAYRFNLPTQLMESPQSNPDNWCFCKGTERNTTSTSTCKSSGVLDLAACREGSSIIVSSAHFYKADPDLISGVDGISPEPEKHKTFLDLEPRSGVMLRAMQRIQFNMMLKQYEYLETFKNVPNNVVFPLLWIEESAALEGESLKSLQTITQVFNIVGIAKWIVLAVGALLLGAGVTLASLRKAEIIPKSVQ